MESNLPRVSVRLVCVALLYSCCCNVGVAALIPATPAEQTKLAIQSLRHIIQQDTMATTNTNDEQNQAPKGLRLFVDYLIPLPPATVAADIDPWPGGLAQMYPYAEDIVKEILRGVVDDPTAQCVSQVISEPDCSGFFIQESKASPKNDIAAIVFPGVDQLDKIEEIDNMVGKDRTLLIFNRQFTRPVDFGFQNKAATSKCNRIIFDRFKWGFAFQEFACRGEDVKLTFDSTQGGWQSCVICDEDTELGAKEISLLDPQQERPLYDVLTKKINEVLPEPLWMRKMGEAETKGFKFQRGGPKEE